MNTNDFKAFGELWLSAHELSTSNQRPSNGAVSMAFEMLSMVSLADVTKALLSHSAKSRFAPTPADILAILGKQTPQHIGADEAWAIALASMDEAETAVMTDEIMQARAIAWQVYNNGDAIGARMAFRSAYERILQSAGNPVWRVSVGHDPNRREEAIAIAVEKGLLPSSELQKHRLEKPQGTLKQLAITATEKTKKVEVDKADEIIKRLEALRVHLVPDEDGALQRERERMKFEANRENELAKVAEKMASLGFH